MTRWLPLVSSCALIVAACEGAAPALTQPSGPSTPGLPTPQLAVRIDSRGFGVAIAGVTEVTFDARGTQGDKLRYEIQFGDGTSATTPVATHVYATTGTFTATLTVTDAADRRSSTSASVVVKAVTGTWFYSDYNERTRRAEVHRIAISEQQAATLGGVYATVDEPDRLISGTLTADRNVRLVVADQSVRFDGVVPGDVPADMSLTVTGGRIDGQTLMFHRASERSVGGNYGHPGGGFSPFSGTLDGAGGIEITLVGGGITFTGRLVRDYAAYQRHQMELNARGGSADQVKLLFDYDPGP